MRRLTGGCWRVVPAVADESFNCVTVDQHTSTSDTFCVLANGLAGNRKIMGGGDLAKFQKALLEVADSLARQIAQGWGGGDEAGDGDRDGGGVGGGCQAGGRSDRELAAVQNGDPWGRSELGAVCVGGGVFGGGDESGSGGVQDRGDHGVPRTGGRRRSSWRMCKR